MIDDEGSHFEIRMSYFVDGPFKASACVIVEPFEVIGEFRVRDDGDSSPTVVLTRPTKYGRREIIKRNEILRRYGPAILTFYRGYGPKQPITALVPRPTKPPTLYARAARPLPDHTTT